MHTLMVYCHGNTTACLLQVEQLFLDVENKYQLCQGIVQLHCCLAVTDMETGSDYDDSKDNSVHEDTIIPTQRNLIMLLYCYYYVLLCSLYQD